MGRASKILRENAHFVECGPGNGYEITSIKYIPAVPAIPPAPMRDEAYCVAANDKIIWFDPNWTVLSYGSFGVGTSTYCGMPLSDDDGNIYINYGTAAAAGPCFSLFDTDLVETVDVLSPSINLPDWSSGCSGGGMHFSTTGTHIFVRASSPRSIWKFDLSTGLDEWYVQSTWSGGLDVDSNDNIYIYKDGYYYKYDSDGNYVSKVAGSTVQTGILYDEEDSRIYSCGWSIKSLYPTKYRQVRAINWDGTNADSFSIDEDNNDTATGQKKIGEYLYVTGIRNQTGVGGAWASVWKLDEDLNLIASYDSAYGYSSYGIFLDWDDNLAIIHGDKETGDTNAGIWILDTDLNYIANYPANTNITSLSGVTGVRIPYLDDGTPGTDGYWEIYTSTGGAVDLSHLVGETVCILADGVVYPSQVVDDNGHIDASAFSTATNVHIGLNYISKLAPMKPMSQPDMMKKKATCKQMGISVHNTDDSNGRAEGVSDTGVKYGVHDDDMKEINFNSPEWKNKSAIDGLFTGSVAVHVPDGFGVNMPLQITTNSPLPATVRAMIPRVDVTGA